MTSSDEDSTRPGFESQERDETDETPGLEKEQVSEISDLDPAKADTPISPDESTAGYPESEAGEPDEGSAGPEASPPENRRDRRV